MQNTPFWNTPPSLRHSITCNPGYSSYWRDPVPNAPAANNRGRQIPTVALIQTLIRSPGLSLAWRGLDCRMPGKLRMTRNTLTAVRRGVFLVDTTGYRRKATGPSADIRSMDVCAFLDFLFPICAPHSRLTSSKTV